MNELVRITAFGGRGIGMPSSGSGQLLTNETFLDFQRKFITPHKTVISLSNLANPDQVIAAIKQKISLNYPDCTHRNTQSSREKHLQFPSRTTPVEWPGW